MSPLKCRLAFCAAKAEDRAALHFQVIAVRAEILATALEMFAEKWDVITACVHRLVVDAFTYFALSAGLW